MRRGALTILAAFERWHRAFRQVTGRARQRFAARDWRALQREGRERLALYGVAVLEAVESLRAEVGDATADRAFWIAMKPAYSDAISMKDDLELAETFFNSVSRRIFSTQGVEPQIEFISSRLMEPPSSPGAAVTRTYPFGNGLEAVIGRVLSDFKLDVPYEDQERDTRRAADEVRHRLTAAWGSPRFDTLEVMRPVFYRNKGAYLFGRFRSGGRTLPLAVALLHGDGGVAIDAVLCNEEELSIVFSFTRSYFHVDVERPFEVIEFLKSMMPLKRFYELYLSLGHNRHAKTLLYRDLWRHLRVSSDRFVMARGDRGLVMLVFTLPSFDLVFKVIRDDFGFSKTSNRQSVMRKYQLVFLHDRGGRLVEAQEYEHLRFEKARFEPALLEDLERSCADMVRIDDGSVTIRHLYAERRVTPLNLWLREQPLAAATAAIVDYGQCIKDLAATDIFVGDILLKNFGVTRHGRVVCYDYDELGSLRDCRFRDLPPAREFDEQSDGEPGFYVGQNDIFPEEFLAFLGLTGPVRDAFVRAHGDLLAPGYYRAMQKRLESGDIVEIFPYGSARRLEARA